MTSQTIIVISDLHISAGPLDDFDEELESLFLQFIGELCERTEPVELVINGDFLDFVQAPPWQGQALCSESKDIVPLCFTEEQSITKLEAILERHKSVFKAAGKFLLANDENRLVILPGNHDADFFWPSVRAILSDALFAPAHDQRDRFVFHLEQTYRPPDCPEAWIEHGHQYDPCNRFYVEDKPFWSAGHPPIFEDRNGENRLFECVGTRFLNRFLNKLDHEYPFVDNVKPFSRFLAIFGASALDPGFGPLKAAASVWSMLRFLAGSTYRHPRDLLGVAGVDVEHCKHPALGIVERLAKSDQAVLVERLARAGFVVDRPLGMYLSDPERADRFMEFLSGNLELLGNIGVERSGVLGLSHRAGTLTLSQAYTVNETELLMQAARRIINENGLDVAIMGHTHERVDPSPELRYINTGTWTRYYRFQGHDQPRPWSVLRSGSYQLFPYQLNYAEVHRAHPLLIQLQTFRERNR